MDKPPLKRNFWISAGIHCGILMLIILVPLIMSFRTPKKEKLPDMVFVDLSSMPEVAPEIPAAAVVEPPPPPPPRQDIPEPPKKKKKKKIEKSKKRIKRDDKPKKKPDKPKLSEEEIRKLLQMGAKPSNTSSVRSDDLPGWYYALVRQTMYEAWAQPGGLAATPGQVARVKIRVERNGRISSRKLVSSSGVKVIDDSAMAAVQKITHLKELPSSYQGKTKDITIDFELTGF